MPHNNPAVILIDQTLARLKAGQTREPVTADTPVLQVQFYNHGKLPVTVTSVQEIVDGFKRRDIAFQTAKLIQGKPTDAAAYDVTELLTWCVDAFQKKEGGKEQELLMLCDALTRIVESSTEGGCNMFAVHQHFYKQLSGM